MGNADAFASFLAVGILIYLVVEIRSLRQLIENHREQVEDQPHETFYTLTVYASPPTSGWVIWLYKNGRWTLGKKNLEKGYVPGPPPAFPGRYEGHSVQQDAVRDSSNR